MPYLRRAADSLKVGGKRWEDSFRGEKMLRHHTEVERDNARKQVGFWRGVAIALGVVAGLLAFK